MPDARSLLRPPDDPARAGRLADWFAGVRRDLPWRGGDDLYGIWVSEIMLQQTTVQAVVPYWERFMARFPDVAALAAAPEQDVLAAWAGLGYYSRARNLQAAARRLVAEHGGRLPRTRDAWADLPGVGPYASGAIASLGLGERVPAMDANARRVVARWAVTDPAAWRDLPTGRRDRAVDALGADLVPAADPGGWNEALMELGALVCGARRADCGTCPVAGSCRAGSGGWADEVPPPRAVRRPQPVAALALVLRWRGRVLLVPPGAPPWPLAAADGRPVARADLSGLHRGLWGVPATVWYEGADAPAASPDWSRPLDLARGLPALPALRALGEVWHGITRYRLHVTVLGAELPARCELPASLLDTPGAAPGTAAAGVFVPGDGPLPPLSRMAEKVLHFQQDLGV